MTKLKLVPERPPESVDWESLPYEPYFGPTAQQEAPFLAQVSGKISLKKAEQNFLARKSKKLER